MQLDNNNEKRDQALAEMNRLFPSKIVMNLSPFNSWTISFAEAALDPKIKKDETEFI